MKQMTTYAEQFGIIGKEQPSHNYDQQQISNLNSPNQQFQISTNFFVQN